MGAPAHVGPIRRDEQRASAAIVGDVEFLGWSDGLIVEGLDRTYLEHLAGETASAEDFLCSHATAEGARLGVELATTFEVVA